MIGFWPHTPEFRKSIFPTSKHVFFSGFCHSNGEKKERKEDEELDLGLLYILILGTSTNSLGKIISYHSAFAFRSSARVLVAGLLRQGHVHPKTLIEMWITCLDRVAANSEKGRGFKWAVRVGQRLHLRFGQSRAVCVVFFYD